jgi:hypothetical protein
MAVVVVASRRLSLFSVAQLSQIELFTIGKMLSGLVSVLANIMVYMHDRTKRLVIVLPSDELRRMITTRHTTLAIEPSG